MDKNTKKKLLLLKLSIQFAIALALSLVMTTINYGFEGAFLQNWAKGFIVAFLIIPLALQIIPFVARAVRAVIGNASPFAIRCVVAVCVAAMMEGLIALAITFAQHGFGSGWASVWALTFVKALPLGLFIGFTMTFLVQPRMQRLAAAAQG